MTSEFTCFCFFFFSVPEKKQKIKDVLSNEKLRGDNSYVQVPAWVPETPRSGQTYPPAPTTFPTLRGTRAEPSTSCL